MRLPQHYFMWQLFLHQLALLTGSWQWLLLICTLRAVLATYCTRMLTWAAGPLVLNPGKVQMGTGCIVEAVVV